MSKNKVDPNSFVIIIILYSVYPSEIKFKFNKITNNNIASNNICLIEISFTWSDTARVWRRVLLVN